jgi:hypothetical protein
MALGLAAVVAAGLTLSCSGGAFEPGDMIQGTGYCHYFPLEGGFWGIEGDDGEHYDTINFPSSYEQEGLRVAYILENTGNASFHMVGPVVRIMDIWPEGSRFPR